MKMKANISLVLVIALAIVFFVALFVLFALFHGRTLGDGLDKFWNSTQSLWGAVRNVSIG